MNKIVVPEDTLDSWLSELKPYQQKTLRQFLLSKTPEAAAEEWLTTLGLSNISSFGGQAFDSKPFWEKFKSECRNFLCDENAYIEEKKGLNQEGVILKTALISAMSSALGATLGTTAILLAPAVTLILVVVGKVSVNAYCKI